MPEYHNAVLDGPLTWEAAMEGHLYRCPNGSLQNLALTWGFGHGLRAVSTGSHHRS